MNIKRLISSIAAATLLLHSALAAAENWPSKPIQLVVPFAPGSTPDIVARVVADKLAPRLGKPVIVENKAGAGGNIGTGYVAKATPDGHTIGVTISGPLAANTVLYKKMAYNPQTDFEFITIAATQPSVLVVPTQIGVNDMASLLAKLRENPGKFNYSSMGNGSISHLAMAALANRSGTEIVHVPYAGSGQAVTAILSGETQMAVLPAAAVIPHVKTGKLKALAVATGKRSTLLPELPTLAEAGLSGIQGDAWIGFVAPAKTSPEIVQKLHAEIVRIVTSKEIKEKLAAQLMEPVANTPAEFRDTVRADLARWQPIIKKNNISLD